MKPEMTQPTSLAQRIRYYYPNMVPATILSAHLVEDGDASSLRTDASNNGACYLEVTRSFHDGTYQVRVAAYPDLVRTQGYTVMLNTAQLAQVRPNDCPVSSRAA